jgi:hypothetical protein
MRDFIGLKPRIDYFLGLRLKAEVIHAFRLLNILEIYQK